MLNVNDKNDDNIEKQRTEIEQKRSLEPLTKLYNAMKDYVEL